MYYFFGVKSKKPTFPGGKNRLTNMNKNFFQLLSPRSSSPELAESSFGAPFRQNFFPVVLFVSQDLTNEEVLLRGVLAAFLGVAIGLPSSSTSSAEGELRAW
jgi:hypothetical protein